VSSAVKDIDTVGVFLTYSCLNKGILIGLSWYDQGYTADIAVLQRKIDKINQAESKYYIQQNTIQKIKQLYQNKKKFEQTKKKSEGFIAKWFGSDSGLILI